MRDVFLDLDLDGGVVVIGFWDDSDKCWRITGTNCVIEDPVFGWKEKPVLNLPEVNKAPEWAEITLEKNALTLLTDYDILLTIKGELL